LIYEISSSFLIEPMTDNSSPDIRTRITLFDTTLRDGAQTAGIDFSLEDKKAVVALLDTLGLDYIEGGYPGANPLDTAFFEKKRTQKAKFAAFGMTARPGRSADNDTGISLLLQAKADTIVFVAKTWDYHVRVALEASLEDNLASLKASVARAVAAGREVIVDCEHFFDGFKANPDYAIACAKTAFDAGARWVVMCDTNGGTLPNEIKAIVTNMCTHISGEHLGIHAHDDCGCGVANSLAAIEAGARHIQGTLNGLGERCGNANLVTIIGTLKLKALYSERFCIGVDDEALTHLTAISRTLDEILNRSPYRHAPFVGASAFSTKAGIHASALIKDPRTYEHVPPEKVGNVRRMLVSDQAGKSNILAELARLGIHLEKNDQRLSDVLEHVKAKEAQGYAFEGADASFFLLVKRILKEVPHFFDVERFSVNVERRFNAQGMLATFAEATVKVRIGDETFMSAAEGSGPVHALDMALRKDLGPYQEAIAGLELLDYKVRIFQGGSDAVTRVFIETGDRHAMTADDKSVPTLIPTWTTVGVSPNIIDASFEALSDSITYALMQKGMTVEDSK
jgi:2-isopropylmalate synthase